MQGESSGHGGKYHNLFEYYSEKDTAPHEKNVSRGLMILLKSEPLLLDRFIELVNDRLPKDARPIPKPVTLREPDLEIDFLRDVSEFANPENVPQRIVGVALTPFGAEPGEALEQEKSSLANVAVRFEDDLVLLEVRTAPAADAGARVAELARHIRATLEKAGEKVLPEIVSPLALDWEDMIDTLDDVRRLRMENERSVLGHYIRYVDSRHPELRSAKPFSAALGLADAQKRVRKLAAGCAQILPRKYGWDFVPASRKENDPNVFGGVYCIIPLGNGNFGFAREVHMCAEGKDGKFESAKAVLWIANNKAQGAYFFGSKKIRDDLSWMRGEGKEKTRKLNVEGGTVEVRVTPYVKFSHIMGRYVMQAYCCPEKVGTDRGAVRKEFFEPLARKWTREEWPKLRHFLTETHKGLLTCGDPEEFDSGFRRFFENSEKQFTYVNFGYEVSFYFYAEDLGRVDAESGAGRDKAAEWVVNAIDALKAEIENPAV